MDDSKDELELNILRYVYLSNELQLCDVNVSFFSRLFVLLNNEEDDLKAVLVVCVLDKFSPFRLDEAAWDIAAINFTNELVLWILVLTAFSSEFVLNIDV